MLRMLVANVTETCEAMLVRTPVVQSGIHASYRAVLACFSVLKRRRERQSALSLFQIYDKQKVKETAKCRQ